MSEEIKKFNILNLPAKLNWIFLVLIILLIELGGLRLSKAKLFET